MKNEATPKKNGGFFGVAGRIRVMMSLPKSYKGAGWFIPMVMHFLKNGFRMIGRAGSEWSEGVEVSEGYRVV